MDILIDLNGDPCSVAFTDTEAADKGHFFLQLMFADSILKQLHNFGRALQMAGASNTNLYNHIFDHAFLSIAKMFRKNVFPSWKEGLLYVCLYNGVEEVFHGIGRYGVELFVYHNANTLLTLAETEGSAQFNLVTETVFRDKILKAFHYLTGTLEGSSSKAGLL